MQHDLDGVEYLIIDEFSVVGQKMFAWINRRCKQATGNLTIPFGGMSIILVGDIAELPPVTDQVCITQNLIVTWHLKDTACIKCFKK